MNLFKKNKWLILRRLSQLAFLGLFLIGPLTGLWIVKGTLAESLTLGVLPLTDPLVLLQSLSAGHKPEATALIGCVIVLTVYALLRGRLYCSWVCPVNIVTDAAAWTRRKLDWREGMNLGRRPRLAVLLGALIASAVTGTIAWEVINPVTQLHRGLVFGSLSGLGAAVVVVVGLFLFDTAVALRGWCGHLCPVGAFYGLLGKAGAMTGVGVAVSAPRRAACDDCRDCYHVCPEPQVITPALKGDGSPLIASSDCTACGRCVDVCPQDVFAIGMRRPSSSPLLKET
jgi:ferredoxin-type protein NapH